MFHIYLKYLNEDTASASQSQVPFNFNEIDNALEAYNLGRNERIQLFKVLAGILLLGNICFEAFEEKCQLSEASKQVLLDVATLFSMDGGELEACLTSRRVLDEKYVVRDFH